MKKVLLLMAAVVLGTLAASAQQQDMRTFVDNLMARMTLQEKIG